MSEGAVTVSFDAAKILKFVATPGKMGQTIGQLQIEIESDNPYADFANLHHLKAGTYVTVTIQSQVGTGGEA